MPAHPPRATVTHHFRASATEVFDAWIDPDSLGTWMFGPGVRDEEIVSLDLQARVGGAFSFKVRRQGELIDHIGTYLALDRPGHLAFTWGVAQDEGATSRVSIDITPLVEGCELTLTHELHPDWRDYIKPTEAAWKKMLYTLGRTFDDGFTGDHDAMEE